MILNILPILRYGLLKHHYYTGTLTRKDLMINPFFFIIDMPWVLGILVISIITPWRLVTTYRYLIKHHEHFP